MPVLAAEVAPMPSAQRACDGSVVRWGDADTPLPPGVVSPGAPTSVMAAVSPVRPGHAMTVDYRLNGGPLRQAIGLAEPRAHHRNGRLFRAVLPGQPGGLVEFLPVLRFAGQPISPRLGEADDYPSYRVGDSAPGEATPPAAIPPGRLAGQPLWDWHSRYLWSGTIMLHKEVIGPVPDGLRIAWHFTEGHFVGPDIEGDILPGAADWMRIRADGIAIVDVKEVLRTRSGARLYCTYGGILELGADGYARALRGEFDPLPSFVTTPTFATADKELAWLNRVQCVEVGRVDLKAMRVEYDLYAVEVRGRRRAGQGS
ncbi:MAG TPA: DUF3237 domain-containing protein [Acetobacteraceae bacterium]|nr:DUF3237 domain-containing protein [Acetobacteraceae bacterium]